MSEIKVNVYGLKLTRKKYIIMQWIVFVWLLVLYFIWHSTGLIQSKWAGLRYFDALLLVLYLYGLIETFVVLRKFKKAKKRIQNPLASTAKPGGEPRAEN